MNRYNVMAANGGLIGLATEAERFAQMHLNGGELDGVRILSPEAVAQMQEMQSSTSVILHPPSARCAGPGRCKHTC